MASAAPNLQQLVGPCHLDGLLDRFDLRSPSERSRFEASWRVLQRHAPLFGCADHPDLDPEHLDLVHDMVHEQLAEDVRRGRSRVVEDQAVSKFVSALNSAYGLPVIPLEPELEAMLEPAAARLHQVVGTGYVPLSETFGYHQSLARHYDIEREAFVELIDWTVAQLQRPSPPRGLERFLALATRSSPRSHAHRPARRRLPVHEPVSVNVHFVSEGALPLELHEVSDLPTPLRTDPTRLATFASSSAPARSAEVGAGSPLSQRWYLLLSAALDAAGIATTGLEQLGETKALPEFVETALLVHLLGLEDRCHKAVLADAADRLLVHRLVPMARSVGARTNRHEPIAAYLSSVLARALRPWSFEAPPLSVAQHVVVLAMLTELGTAKARKLLHQAKKHIGRHESPELIRTAINRNLARWSERVGALSPKRRIDRVAAGFRYMNRSRRGTDPRARDLAIVSEFLA